MNKINSLHAQALSAAKNLKRSECELIDVLQKIDDCQGYLKLGYTSLHLYVTQALGLSDDCAYRLARVARKAVQVPELKEAVIADKITLSKAAVIASVINTENKQHWLDVATTSTKREIEKAVANVNPEAPKPEKVRAQGNKNMRLDFTLDEESYAFLQRAQELLEQKEGRKLTLAETVRGLSERFVKKEDPVAKADRNASKIGPGANFEKASSTKTSSKINSATAALHQVHARDRGACQFRLPNGKPYGQRKWIHVHHLKPRSAGGPDTPENLLTLCAGHHRIVHAKAAAAP